MFSLLLLIITIGCCLMTYLFLKKKEYSDIVIVLALQIILIILIFIYTKYNLYCLMEVETIKIEALDKLVQEVETMKKTCKLT